MEGFGIAEWFRDIGFPAAVAAYLLIVTTKQLSAIADHLKSIVRHQKIIRFRLGQIEKLERIQLRDRLGSEVTDLIPDFEIEEIEEEGNGVPTS